MSQDYKLNVLSNFYKCFSLGWEIYPHVVNGDIACWFPFERRVADSDGTRAKRHLGRAIDDSEFGNICWYMFCVFSLYSWRLNLGVDHKI